MSLLKDIMKEMAAGGSVGAGAVASAPGSLFGGGAVDANKSKKKQRRMFRRLINMSEEDVKVVTPSNKWKDILEASTGETAFDSADVISKLDAAEKKANVDEDSVAFGLEDEDGNIVKIHVRADQAKEFESALATMLAGDDDDDDEGTPQEEDKSTALEIAEVLFNLKDRFEIVDVEWGEITGDEEEEQEIEGGEGDDIEMDAEGGDIEGGEGGEGDDLEMDAEGEGLGDEEDAKSALQQVIDMMKADAEAKKAEANAREAEAKAKEAETAAGVAASKVKQEEEVLNMEAHYKQKKDEEGETKRLAQLAKWKHETASDAETKLATEDEEQDVPDSEISVDELSNLIFRHLQHQG